MSTTATTTTAAHRETIADDLTIFGVAIKDWSADEAIAQLDKKVSTGQMTAVGFANANLLHHVSHSTRLRRQLSKFIMLNDGAAMDIARLILCGDQFKANLNGTDFVPLYLTKTTATFRIFLLGSRRAVVTQAAEKIRERFSKHQVVGWLDGYDESQDANTVLAKIRAANANLLLVGMGNPVQELWLAAHGEHSGCILAFGVGALFDFVAGTVPRAPGIIRRLRLEWAFRLLLEPRRLAKRYLIDTIGFLYHVLVEACRTSQLMRQARAFPRDLL
jgi:alpha-1,3-mannosyltransferase